MAAELHPRDLSADELYALLKENPDTKWFTPEDLEAYKGRCD